ncbi:hypothetical protein NL676_012184 [Syzygium grande]|nr:hypothetical protein NL676_012184 [Syzygium grande]
MEVMESDFVVQRENGRRRRRRANPLQGSFSAYGARPLLGAFPILQLLVRRRRRRARGSLLTEPAPSSSEGFPILQLVSSVGNELRAGVRRTSKMDPAREGKKFWSFFSRSSASRE